MIEFCTQPGEIHKEMLEAFEPEVVGIPTVFRWCKHFKEGIERFLILKEGERHWHYSCM